MSDIPNYVQDYCDRNSYTEPQFVDGEWWAFPPSGVMPVVIPVDRFSDQVVRVMPATNTVRTTFNPEGRVVERRTQTPSGLVIVEYWNESAQRYESIMKQLVQLEELRSLPELRQIGERVPGRFSDGV
jgi:hypothetical protein